MKIRTLAATLLFLFTRAFAAQPTNEWLTWGYDQERTGWNRAETTLSKDNVSQLELKWKTQLSTAPNEVILSTLTAPLVAVVNNRTLVYVVGSDNTVYAIDSATGKVAWQRAFPNPLKPRAPATWLCSNSQNATPVVDKEAGIIYVSTSDGKLRGLNLADGADRMSAVDFTTPFARNWSLNLVDGIIYSSSARGCGDTIAHFTAIDVKDPAHRKVENFTSGGRPGGAWGRGGLVRGPRGMYTQTADGPYDPAGGIWGETVMYLNFKDLRLLDSYTPTNWKALNAKDQDLGSASPVVFPFEKWTLLASAAKESVITLLDDEDLGGQFDHHTPLYQTPRWGNDGLLLAGQGVWGALSTWQDGQGRRWLLLPMWGPPSKDAPAFQTSYGPAPEGSIMAFEVRLNDAKDKPMLVPIWMSRDMHVPDPPVVANGVVYALQTGKNTTESRTAGKMGSVPATNAVLYALDAETGQQLYSSEKLIDSWTHFSEPVVAGGRVYVSTWDGRVYAFGLKK